MASRSAEQAEPQPRPGREPESAEPPPGAEGAAAAVTAGAAFGAAAVAAPGGALATTPPPLLLTEIVVDRVPSSPVAVRIRLVVDHQDMTDQLLLVVEDVSATAKAHEALQLLPPDLSLLTLIFIGSRRVLELGDHDILIFSLFDDLPFIEFVITIGRLRLPELDGLNHRQILTSR